MIVLIYSDPHGLGGGGGVDALYLSDLALSEKSLVSLSVEGGGVICIDGV